MDMKAQMDNVFVLKVMSIITLASAKHAKKCFQDANHVKSKPDYFKEPLKSPSALENM